MFGRSVFLPGHPNQKMQAGVLVGSEPGRFNFIVQWPLIFKFYSVFSYSVFVPAFAQGDQFHRLSLRDS